jgi:hypothetical protein
MLARTQGTLPAGILGGARQRSSSWAPAAAGRDPSAWRQACPCVRRQRRPGRPDRCKQHLRNRMAAEKRTAAYVSGGRSGRVVYTTDSSHKNPRGPARPARSAGKTCDNELKSRNDVVPGLRRGIVDSYLKLREAAFQLLRAASGAFRCREPGLQLAVDFDRKTGSRQFGMNLWYLQVIQMGCGAVRACVFLR